MLQSDIHVNAIKSANNSWQRPSSRPFSSAFKIIRQPLFFFHNRLLCLNLLAKVKQRTKHETHLALSQIHNQDAFFLLSFVNIVLIWIVWVQRKIPHLVTTIEEENVTPAPRALKQNEPWCLLMTSNRILFSEGNWKQNYWSLRLIWN